MKLKRFPEDFRVDELTDFQCNQGRFAVYQLFKKSIGTPEAIQAIIHRWNLGRSQIAYGGLKDKHAETSQWVTIDGGPVRSIDERSFRLEYVGQASRHFQARDITGNRFAITLRNIHKDSIADLDAALITAKAGGIPNYFDDQRFGSLGRSKQFMAEPWCKGDYERALWLALAEENVHDRGRELEQKRLLRELWGQWLELKRQLDRSHRRSIVTYLCDHPTDFKRALANVRVDMRSLYLAAFQSHLWNEMLGKVLQSRLGEDRIQWVRGAAGRLAFPIGQVGELMGELRGLKITLPSARVHNWSPEMAEILASVLKPLGMQSHEIRVKYPRDSFFSKGDRPALLELRGMRHELTQDEAHAGRYKLLLEFDLGRGSYATMLVRWLQKSPEDQATDVEELDDEDSTSEDMDSEFADSGDNTPSDLS